MNLSTVRQLAGSAVLALVCTLPMNVLSAQEKPGANAADQRIVLLVDEIKAIRNLPVVLAERLGYLQDNEHVVTVMNIRDDATTADMLMDGRVDAVMAYYHHNIVNQAEGRDFEAIVTLGVTPGAKVLVATQARGKFHTAADLKGSRIIAGGAGSSKTTLANALVLAGGHGIDEYTRIANESKEAIADTLRHGDADLVVAPTPDGDYYLAQHVATEFADLTTVEGTRRHLGELFPTATVYMRSARVASRPDIAQHLATAFVRTLRWLNSHTPEEIAARVPASISGKDRETYLRTLKQELPMFNTDGRMPAAAAQKEWEILKAATPKYQSVDVAKTYSNQFVDAALKSGGVR